MLGSGRAGRLVRCLVLAALGLCARAYAGTGDVGRVITVTGPVDPRLLGPTLIHEHLFYDWFEGLPGPRRDGIVDPMTLRRMQERGWAVPRSREELLLFTAPDVTLAAIPALRTGARMRANYVMSDPMLMAREVAAFQAVGGRTIVDQTPRGLGRDLARLRSFSRLTGLTVVAGTGWYRWPFHPPALRRQSIEWIARRLIRDVEEGDESGVRSGIIGEIPLDSRSVRISAPLEQTLADSAVAQRSGAGRARLLAVPAAERSRIPLQEIYDEAELRVLRAAARASAATGAALSLHVTDPWLGYLDALEAEGADLSRVIISHAHGILGDPVLLEAALRRGVVLQADYDFQHYPTFAPVRPIDATLDGIARAIRTGRRDQILLSLDICNRIGLRRYGGGGYSTLQELILPQLRARGVSEADILHVLVENPRRLLTIAPRR